VGATGDRAAVAASVAPQERARGVARLAVAEAAVRQSAPLRIAGAAIAPRKSATLAPSSIVPPIPRSLAVSARGPARAAARDAAGAGTGHGKASFISAAAPPTSARSTFATSSATARTRSICRAGPASSIKASS